MLYRLNSDSNLYKTNNQSLSLLYRQVYFKCDWCPVLYVNFVLDFSRLEIFIRFVYCYILNDLHEGLWKVDLQA